MRQPTPTTAHAARTTLVRALRGAATEHVPIWLMRQAGRYLPEYRRIRERVAGFLELCYTPELAAEVTLQPVERFGVDAAILFSDILVVPDALGQQVDFREGEGPVLAPVEDAAALAQLSPARVVDHLAPVYQTVRAVRKVLPETVALIGFAGGPWTVATYMVEGGSSRDFGAVKQWAYGAPDSFDQLIATVTEATVAHLSAQIDAGADVVQLFDSWAGALPPPALDRWVVTPTRAIVERLHAQHPEVPIIGFPRRIGPSYPAYVKRTGVDAVSLDDGIPPAWAVAHLQRDVALQGNLDPILLLTGGPPMRAAAQAILTTFGSGRFVFNLGHGVVPATPPDHVAELVDLVHAWRRG